MKKPLLTPIIALACIFCGIWSASAQTASFTFNDNIGAPSAGSYFAGTSFSFDITLNFTPGGNVQNLEGLSYWLQQNSGGPFIFSITNRNVAGSMFTVLQSPGSIFPQAMNPSNASDLGAALVGSTGLGAGSYFIATITISISQTAANGVYLIGNTFAGFKTSVVSDDQGDTFNIASSTYAVTVVPDTGSTLLLLSCGFLGLLGLARRQQRA